MKMAFKIYGAPNVYYIKKYIIGVFKRKTIKIQIKKFTCQGPLSDEKQFLAGFLLVRFCLVRIWLSRLIVHSPSFRYCQVFDAEYSDWKSMKILFYITY